MILQKWYKNESHKVYTNAINLNQIDLYCKILVQYKKAKGVYTTIRNHKWIMYSTSLDVIIHILIIETVVHHTWRLILSVYVTTSVPTYHIEFLTTLQ